MFPSECFPVHSPVLPLDVWSQLLVASSVRHEVGKFRQIHRLTVVKINEDGCPEHVIDTCATSFESFHPFLDAFARFEKALLRLSIRSHEVAHIPLDGFS